MNESDLQHLLRFFHDAGRLKTLVRAGWTRHDVPDPESVAEHSFRMALIAMALGERLGLDTLRLIEMCLIHDLPEVTTGDITPFDGVSNEEKHRREHEALQKLARHVPDGKRYLALWREYEAQETAEAQAVRQIDKLEMVMQAYEYHQTAPDNDFSEFVANVDAIITIEELRAMFEALRGGIETS